MQKDSFSKGPGPTDSVDNLVDHHFREFKLFVFAMADILSDHGSSLVIITQTAPPTIQGMAFIIIVIKCTHSMLFPKSTVPQRASLVVLVSEIEWLEEK